MKPFFMFKCVLLLASCACESFAVTIGMKPLRESDAQTLPEVNGIYFEPMGSNDYVCHKNIPRDCNGTIAVDLSKDSSITIDWVASDSNPVDKYISLRGAEANTVNFEFRAMYECNGDEPYQAIEGDSISYAFDYFPNTAVGEFSYNPTASFIELGKFGSMCGIFATMEFGAGPSGELNLDIKKASFTANYDTTKVVQGSKAHAVSTSKFNWINFGSTASATSISFGVKRIPIYPSSSPTDPPTGSPTVSSRPTSSPTYTPAPTKSSAPTASPTEKVTTTRDATSGSKYCSTHFMVSTVGFMMAALLNMF